MTPNLPATMSSTTVLSAAASLAASAMLIRTIASDLVPHQVQDYILFSITSLLTRFSSQQTIVIEEFKGFSINQMYKAADTYLGTKISPMTKRLKASKQDEQNNIEISMEQGVVVVDAFQGIQFTWRLSCKENNHPALHRNRRFPWMDAGLPLESRYFELSFHKKHKDLALTSYLPYILEQSKAIKQEAKTLKLYTNEDKYWSPVNFRHPATFDTLAMDPELKRAIMEDLSRFMERKEYYRRIGKAWKRGYLLHGPPGTGKSSLIAAMANFLKFDVYDLELTEVRRNSTLRQLLVGTENRSIIVVEDIDCSLDLQQREGARGGKSYMNSPDDQPGPEDKVTLSGLLNFVDGLWSTCGDGRVIIFTTNYKERLDPALMRPGRMDMHIHMTYCCPSGFRILASNYHAIDDHPRFEEIEELISKVEVTPAEVAEELMRSDDFEIALQGLFQLLHRKREEAIEAKAKESVDSMTKNIEENGEKN